MCAKYILPLLLLFGAMEASRGATYYVATNGSDSANGASNTPWATLQKASSNLLPGDTVIVRTGTYSGFVMGWDYPQNGTNGAPITFLANPGATITNRNSKTVDGINLEGASHIVIDGFTILNPGLPGKTNITRAGVRSVGNTNVVVRNCRITGMGTWGIFTSHTDYFLAEGNETANSGTQHGIYISNACIFPTVRRNYSHHNYGCGFHFNGDISQGGNGIISYGLIEENVACSNGFGGGSAINGDGLQDSVIRNNLLYGNHASGISLFQIDAAEGAKRNVVANNTILQPSDGRWCINISGDSASNTIFNNILYNYHAFRGVITVDATSLTGLRSDYNVLMDRLSVDGDNTTVTLAKWRTDTGQDAHSLIATPAQLFVNASTNNYRLKAGSPAFDAGTAAFNGITAPARDLDGNARPMSPGFDIGAYEYVMYRIAATAGVNGAVSPSGTVWVAAGSNQAFAITAARYYAGQSLLVDGLSAGVAMQYTFSALLSNHTLLASFTALLATNNTPQWWLAQYGWTNNFDAAAMADTDGDGLKAWQEYVAGTDPTNQASVLALTSISRTNPPSVVIRWSSASNRYYTVYRGTNLATGVAGFVPVVSNLVSQPPLNVYTDTVSGAGAYFYTIGVRP